MSVLTPRIAEQTPSITNLTLTPIYFLHIPKTGGSSVFLWLQQHVGENHTCAAKNWDELIRVDRAELRKYRVFCGHFGIDLQGYLRRHLQTLTVLRDPVQRTISHYYHVCRDTCHPRHHRVVRETLDEFVRNPDNWPMIDNFQARYLIRTPLNITHHSARFDRSESKEGHLSVLSEDARFLLDPGYVREKSREVIERDITLIGTTEQLPRFLASVGLEFLLPVPRPEDVPFINIAPVPARDVKLTPGTHDVIKELTLIDQDLWDLIRSRTPAQMTPQAGS